MHRHLITLRDRRLLCNVILRADGLEFPIHAYMLMAHTDAFTKILHDDSTAFDVVPVVIDFSGIIMPHIVKQVVDFFYYGRFNVRVGNIGFFKWTTNGTALT